MASFQIESLSRGCEMGIIYGWDAEQAAWFEAGLTSARLCI